MALRIPERWRVWRGYQLSGWTRENAELSSAYWTPGSWLHTDPMDTTTYDESKAFPSEKPNFDVYPPPCRTRKQRGWFQVTRFPPHSQIKPEIVITSSTPGPSLYGSGSKLPSELVQQILDELRADPSLSKHDQAVYSTVCRHWADAIRPHIFQDIGINSRESLIALSALTEHPASRAKSYIDRVTLVPTVSSSKAAPFLHLLTIHVGHRVDGTTTSQIRIQLKITGPLPQHYSNTMRSIHWQLPRTVPRVCSFGIARLILENISFKTFYDLLNVVLELPTLTKFEGTSLMWPEFEPRRRSWKPQTGSYYIHCRMRETTTYWPALLLSGLPVGSTEEKDCILKLALALEERLEHVQGASVTADHDGTPTPA